LAATLRLSALAKVNLCNPTNQENTGNAWNRPKLH